MINRIKRLLGIYHCIEYSNGVKYYYSGGWHHWYLNQYLHRDEIDPKTGLTLPAVERSNCGKWWFKNGLRHRSDGPAIEYHNGDTRYWFNGTPIHQLDDKHIYGKENVQKILLLL